MTLYNSVWFPNADLWLFISSVHSEVTHFHFSKPFFFFYLEDDGKETSVNVGP